MALFSPQIRLLHPANFKSQARTLEAELRTKYNTLEVVPLNFHEIERVGVDDTNTADLLIILFDGNEFPSTVVNSIESFQRKYEDLAWVLPVALYRDHAKPPAPLSGINAGVFYEQTAAELEDIVNRVGALLGLWLRGGTKKIFISYRAVDAETIAMQLQAHLIKLGFRAWVDKAPDQYDQPNIKIGEDVQQQIRHHIEASNLVLLLDTPSVLESQWIREEVTLSVRGFVPLLPVVFREDKDADQGPRYESLLSLRRWVDMTWRQTLSGTTESLSVQELDKIVLSMERHLRELASYQLEVPKKAGQAFDAAGYKWSTLDEPRRIYTAEKSLRRTTRILSHCALYSPMFRESLDAFRIYEPMYQEKRHFHYRLFIYGTTILNPIDKAKLEQETGMDSGEIDIRHLSELQEWLMSE